MVFAGPGFRRGLLWGCVVVLHPACGVISYDSYKACVLKGRVASVKAYIINPLPHTLLFTPQPLSLKPLTPFIPPLQTHPVAKP